MNPMRITVIFTLLILTACAHTPLQVNSGNQGDVEIVQGGRAVVIDADGRLRLRGEPFEIRSRWSRVNVCISRSEADLGKVSAGADTVRDMGSCFNLGKSYAMEGDARYLIVGEGVNTLNEAHGMRRNGQYFWFPVGFLYDETSHKEVSLGQTAGLYFTAFWVDKNGDRRLDAGEFALMPLLFDPIRSKGVAGKP